MKTLLLAILLTGCGGAPFTVAPGETPDPPASALPPAPSASATVAALPAPTPRVEDAGTPAAPDAGPPAVLQDAAPAPAMDAAPDSGAGADPPPPAGCSFDKDCPSGLQCLGAYPFAVIPVVGTCGMALADAGTSAPAVDAAPASAPDAGTCLSVPEGCWVWTGGVSEIACGRPTPACPTNVVTVTCLIQTAKAEFSPPWSPPPECLGPSIGKPGSPSASYLTYQCYSPSSTTAPESVCAGAFYSPNMSGSPVCTTPSC